MTRGRDLMNHAKTLLACRMTAFVDLIHVLLHEAYAALVWSFRICGNIGYGIYAILNPI